MNKKNQNAVETLSLVEFLATLKEAHREDSNVPYYNLPEREALCLMLGIGDESGRLRNKDHGLMYSIKVYDEIGNEMELNHLVENIRSNNNNLLKDCFVKRDEIALVYDHLEFPWRDSDNKIVFLYGSEYKKEMFIPYVRAKRILQERFNATQEEIDMWLYMNEIKVRGSQYGDAKISSYKYAKLQRMIGIMPDKRTFDLSKFLCKWYFSEDELLKFKPAERWLTFYQVANRWADFTLSEDEVLGTIREYFGADVLFVFNTIPMNPHPNEPTDDEIKTAMFKISDIENVTRKIFDASFVVVKPLGFGENHSAPAPEQVNQSTDSQRGHVDKHNKTERRQTEINRWLREIWEAEGKPTGGPFFRALRKYEKQKGSPIDEWYGAGEKAGIKWRTSGGASGEWLKHTIETKASEYRKQDKENSCQAQ